MIIDIVFSLDSIITAIGMAQDVETMIAAVVIACLFMYISVPVGVELTRRARCLSLSLGEEEVRR